MTTKTSKKTTVTNVAAAKKMLSEDIAKKRAAKGIKNAEVIQKVPAEPPKAASPMKMSVGGLTLAEIVNGTSPAVAKAVAEKRAKVEAEKPAAPAKKTKAKKADKVSRGPAKKAKEGKAPRETSGALIKQMILDGDDAETILAAVHKAFPDSAATKGDVSWNRWDLKRKGLLKA